MKLDYIYLHSQRPTICRTILLICTAWNIWTDVGTHPDAFSEADEGDERWLQDMRVKDSADCPRKLTY